MNLAVAYLQKGDAGTAKQILNHLNFFFPREIELDFLKAEAFRQMNLFKDAELQYRLVLAENPDYLSASVGLGDVLMRQGKLEQSRTVLAEAEQQAIMAAQKPEKRKRLKLTE
jgi:predicted Zn-dependent protease